MTDTEQFIIAMDVAAILFVVFLILLASIQPQRRMAWKCCDDCPGDMSCEHADVCMCGCPMKDHDDMWQGHVAVSMHDYYSEPLPYER